MKTRTPLMFVAVSLLASGIAFADSSHGERTGHGNGHRSEMLSKLDSNADGQLQIAEIELNAATRAAQIDSNADGRIDAVEMQAWRQAQRMQRAEKRLLQADSNGDGVVSVEEFAAQQSARVAKLDRNADGVVSSDELRSNRHRMRSRRGGSAD